MNDARQKINNKKYLGMTTYQIFLTLVAFFGWTLVSMDLNMFSTTLPDIMSTFHIPTSYSGLITSAVFGGMAVLQFIMSPLIEYFGRKLMFNITLLGTALFTGLTIFASTVGALIGVRIVADGFSYSEFPAGLTIIQEGVPGNMRGSAYGFVQSGYPVGFFLASVATAIIVPIYGWRFVYLVGVIPAIVVIIARLWVKEPERYKEYKKIKELEEEGKKEEALDENQKTPYKVNAEKTVHFTYTQLFAPDLRRRNFIFTTAEFLHEFTTPTFLFFTAVILEVYKGLSATQALTILAVGTAIAAFGYFFAGLIGNHIKHGRKWTAAASSILGGDLGSIFHICTWLR